MAAFDTSVIGSSASTAVTSQATATLTTAGAGELLLASLHTPAAVTSISVAGGGLTWTLLRSDHNTTSSDAYVSIYYAFAASAFSAAVTFSWTGSVKAIVTASAFTSAGQAPGATHSSQGASVTATDVVTTTKAASLVVGFYTANGSSAYTSPAGQTNSQSGANSGGASSTQCRGVATRQNSTTTNSGTAVTMGGTSDVASSSHWIYDAVEIKNNTSPTTALNTPADTATGISTTPTLNFTGTDADSDTVEYEVQVDTVNTFDSVQASGVDTYYFNASIAGPTNNGSVWTNPANAFDGSTATDATTTDNGGNTLDGTGTTAPTTGGTITQVRARIFGNSNGVTPGVWGSYLVLTTPSGGWTWAKVNGLQAQIRTNVAFPGPNAAKILSSGVSLGVCQDGGVNFSTSGQVYRVEVEVTHGALPLLDKLSTTDAGFTAGHPFTSGVATDFTVQAGDTLTASTTYYWRVRAIDPLGSDTYGAYATTRSFTTASGSTTTPQTTTGLARITAQTTKTQSGKADIKNTTLQTTSGLARIQQLVAQTVPGVSRVTITTSKTQAGTANIKATTSKTQAGKGDIRATTSQPQPGKARLTVSTPQTQLGKARITATTSKTQSGKGDISGTTTQTQAGKARIQLITPKTQSGLGRVTAQNTQAQPGKSRVTITTTKTQAGLARITAQSSQSQLGKARLTATALQTQAGKTRITQTTAQTQAGKARIQQITPKTQLGTSRITQTTPRTQTGVARVTATTSKTQSGVAQINVLLSALKDDFNDNSLNPALWTSSQAGSATVAETNARLELTLPASATSASTAAITSLHKYDMTGASAHLHKIEHPVDTSSAVGNFQVRKDTANLYAWEFGDFGASPYWFNGGSKVYAGPFKANTSTTPLWTRIREAGGTIFWDWSTDGLSWTNLTFVSTFFAITNVDVVINVTESATESNPGRLVIDDFNTLTVNRTQAGLAQIVQTTGQTQLGKASITSAATTKTQPGQARLQTLATQTQPGKARLTAQTTQTQSGKSRLTTTAVQPQSGKSRVMVSTPQTQPGKARVTAQTTKTQAGTARITVQTTKTQPGTARIGLITSQTQLGKARITAQTTKTQSGTANIRNTTTQTQPGTASIRRVGIELQSYPPLLTDTALQHYYRFEGNANDAKGSLTGTANTITYNTSNGRFGQGAGFAGTTGSYIQMGAAFTSGSGNFTVIGWVQTSLTATRQDIAAWGSSNNSASVFFYIGTDNTVYLGIQAVAGAHSAATVTDGNWHMVTGVNTSGSCQVYIDGVLSGSSQTINPNPTTTIGYIGIENNGTGFFNPMQGAIDDLAFFNRALNAGEITAFYTTVATAKTQRGTANITAAAVTTKTQSGQSRITAQTTQTQRGKADITATTTQTQSGKGRVQITSTQTQSGKARLSLTTTKTQPGQARVMTQATKTQAGKTRVTVTKTTLQTGRGRIQLTTTQTTTGTASLFTTTSKTQSGQGTITTRNARPQPGKARVQVVSTKTQRGKATIRTKDNLAGWAKAGNPITPYATTTTPNESWTKSSAPHTTFTDTTNPSSIWTKTGTRTTSWIDN